jgi:Ribbon-helix-helix protein, copG family.
MTYRRVQTLLPPQQYRILKRLAQQRGQSLSAIVREMVRQGLEETLPLVEDQKADLDWLERTHQTAQRMLAARGGRATLLL